MTSIDSPECICTNKVEDQIMELRISFVRRASPLAHRYDLKTFDGSAFFHSGGGDEVSSA
jgi:hypothetical protein